MRLCEKPSNRRHLPPMFQNIPGLGPVPTPEPELTPPLVCSPGRSCCPLTHLLKRNQSTTFNWQPGRPTGGKRASRLTLRGLKDCPRGCLVRGGEQDRDTVMTPRATAEWALLCTHSSYVALFLDFMCIYLSALSP